MESSINKQESWWSYVSKGESSQEFWGKAGFFSKKNKFLGKNHLPGVKIAKIWQILGIKKLKIKKIIEQNKKFGYCGARKKHSGPY